MTRKTDFNLLPCPFCGGKADLQETVSQHPTLYYVICHKCEIRTFVFSKPELAVKRWNRRDK